MSRKKQVYTLEARVAVNQHRNRTKLVVGIFSSYQKCVEWISINDKHFWDNSRLKHFYAICSSTIDAGENCPTLVDFVTRDCKLFRIY